MSEQETLALAEEFARYRRTALAEVEAPGPAAVRRTVRGRGRRRLGVTATTALALLGGSAIGYAAMTGPDQRPGPVDPTPSVSASPTPTSSPTPTPSGTSASPTAPVPDGRISRAQLLGASVTLPAWRAGPGCPTSQTRLSGDDREGVNWLLALDHGDVDGDGAVETVALVQCVLGSGGPMQVVAFDRNEAGKVVTLGRVVATTIDMPQWLFALDVVDDGTVRVQVGDIAPGGGWAAKWSQRQWRGYRWKGDAFAQVSGPTSFGPNPNRGMDVSVTAADLVLTTADDGSRTGTATVRIRNRGAGPVAHVGLRLGVPAVVRADVDGWEDCVGVHESTEPIICRLPELAAGAEMRLDLDFRVAEGITLRTDKADVDARPLDSEGDDLPDVNDSDNLVQMRMIYG
ncbi:hypothetical protein AB0J14_17480 [Micromonospora arborensis]|uniref:hypothetical protein n=1 Tax=Micromonospora arborensis TaxID=2116518 RepID=UPI0033F15947